MAKHIIFLIHGMGSHKTGWSKDIQKVIRDAYQNYEKLKQRPFDQRFEFEEIVYNEVFETFRENWKRDAAALTARLQAGGASAGILETVARLGGMPGDDNFFNTHLLDVVMYHFLSLARVPTRVRVARQITARLASMPQTEIRKWSVIAHSLGTSVAHDTLHYMFTPGASQEIDSLDRRKFGPHAGLFVSNVSRLLQTEVDVYDQSVARPSVNKRNGIFKYYLNARHKLDPAPRPRAFEPEDDWMDPTTRSRSFPCFWNLLISEITARNIHGLDHYLANPGVHIPLFRCLFGFRSMVTDTEEREAVEAYRNSPETLQFGALRRELRSLVEGEGPELQDLLATAKTYYDIIKA